MKKRYLTIMLLGLVLSSCASKSENETTVTYTGGDVTITPTESNEETSSSTKGKETIIPKEYINDIELFTALENDTYTKDIYASPEGEGDGTFEDPASLEDAAIMLKPGYRLLLKDGTYDVGSDGIYFSSSGESDKYIEITALNEGKVKIMSSSKKTSTSEETSLFAFEKNVSYYKITGLEFCNTESANVMGIVMWDGGENHIIINNNTFHDLKTTGVAEDYGANAILCMGEGTTPISDILIYNNNVYDNTLGYSEAISLAGNITYSYVLNNTLTNNTNIGIDFYGNAGYCSEESLDQPRYAVAINNIVSKSISPYADCAGIYVDGARDILLKGNEIKESQYGIEIGSEEKNTSYPVKNIKVENNTIHDNTECAIRIGGYDTSTSGTVTSTEVSGNTCRNNDTSIILSMTDGINIHDNTLNDGITIEFNDTHVKNIQIVNNVFSEDAYFEITEVEISFDDFNTKYGQNEKNSD